MTARWIASLCNDAFATRPMSGSAREGKPKSTLLIAVRDCQSSGCGYGRGKQGGPRFSFGQLIGACPYQSSCWQIVIGVVVQFRREHRCFFQIDRSLRSVSWHDEAQQAVEQLMQRFTPKIAPWTDSGQLTETLH